MSAASILGGFAAFVPDLSPGYLLALLVPIVQTLGMAAGGMLIACLAGLPLGLVVATRAPGTRLLYQLLAGLRAIPDLTLAILCVVVFGIGPAAGLFALALFYTAMIGKVFADLFLAAERRPLDALRATGASRTAVALFGLIPLRLGDLITHGCYSLECAVRAAVIVGAVGGGGLGTELVGTLNTLDYRRAVTLVLVLILIMAGLDHLSWRVRRSPKLVLLLIPVGAAALWIYRPQLLAVEHALRTFGSMLPPRLPAEAVLALPRLLGETLLIAGAGTALGALAALPLGLASARNLAPPALVAATRAVLEALRAVPEVVWGLILVSLATVGPGAGIVALALHSAGVLGKLYAESFENVRPEALRAVEATGAPRLSVAGFALIPLAAGPIAVHSLFRLEWNLRAATVVGMIGAGGIGEALYEAQQLFFYQQMMAYVLITWIVVSAADALSQRTQLRLGCAYAPA
ncbi:MAG TPA: ABC transporter permease subunit [Stellaceae bacterium]|nr:ABC transporter permease subunit [Stellaceae bacterium]